MQDARRNGVAKNDGGDRHSLLYTRMPLDNPDFRMEVQSTRVQLWSAGNAGGSVSARPNTSTTECKAGCRYQHFVIIHFSSRLGHPLASPLQVVD